MDSNTKLSKLKTLLGISGTGEDALLNVYLDMSEQEILNWLYIASSVPENATMPEKYDWVQIQACIAGFNLSGAENQTSHSENGISRQFKYADMVAYIHSNVYPYIGI